MVPKKNKPVIETYISYQLRISSDSEAHLSD